MVFLRSVDYQLTSVDQCLLMAIQTISILSKEQVRVI